MQAIGLSFLPGVVLLEEVLIQSDGGQDLEDRPQKRPRMAQSTASPDTSTWVELAR